MREEAEYAAGHASGALRLPLGAPEAGAPLPETVTGHPVPAVCRSGRRSLKAAELRDARGVEALDVAGGMQAWAEAGLPVRAHEDEGEDGHVV
ncbi:rhodanese-like domain-containing protein [Streptomyces sp. NPDC091217]|uniref:rhodanese-like domain-containing protein n=1 Tax=Streptomyces sp. NPDC091217 TaxID=3365975 RepID=UPI0037F2F4DC